MGFNKFLIFFLFTFLILFTAASSSSSSPPITDQSDYSSSTATAAQYQVFHVKKTAPFLLADKQDRRLQRRLAKKHKKRAAVDVAGAGGKRSKMTKTTLFKNGPFTVMLPKGFVPPSGSSPCHNGNPNSVAFFCDLAKP